MHYIRRRIQRVSGVTVRDERVESRDFSVRREDWDELSADQREQVAPEHDLRSYKRQGIVYRERT